MKISARPVRALRTVQSDASQPPHVARCLNKRSLCFFGDSTVAAMGMLYVAERSWPDRQERVGHGTKEGIKKGSHFVKQSVYRHLMVHSRVKHCLVVGVGSETGRPYVVALSGYGRMFASGSWHVALSGEV